MTELIMELRCFRNNLAGGFNGDVAIRDMDDMRRDIPDDPMAAVRTMTNAKRRKLRQAVLSLIRQLHDFQVALDPTRHPLNVLDPSDPYTIGQLIAETLLLQPRVALANVAAEKFYGSGVYAIYYRGDFDAYKPTTSTETPLYVGKVDPKTPGAKTVEEQGTKLFDRLHDDHARSINAVNNLALVDFDCRYLVVKSAWQNTAETYLIDRFKPIWNDEVGICYGIGKHGDSAKTRSNKRSPWDTLHPGRPWAWTEGNVNNDKSPDQIGAEIAEHYRKHPPK